MVYAVNWGHYYATDPTFLFGTRNNHFLTSSSFFLYIFSRPFEKKAASSPGLGGFRGAVGEDGYVRRSGNWALLSVGFLSTAWQGGYGMLTYLGGGNSKIFGIFNPKLGEDEPILTAYFSDGLVQPPTSYIWLIFMV